MVKVQASRVAFLSILSLVYLFSYPLLAYAASPSFGLRLTDLHSPFSGLELKDSLVPPGAEITEVVPNSPASSEGLQSGDIVVKIEGQGINSLGDFIEVFKKLKSKEEVSLSLNRGGEIFDAKLESRARAEARAAAFVKRYKIRRVANPETLSTDPLVYNSVRIAICLEFVAMTAEDEALFSFQKEKYKISDIPSTAFTGGKYTLAIRVAGSTKAEQRLEYLGYEPGNLIGYISEIVRTE